mmetsp:Transcript_4421/g.10175  ORF Transcript_4421/g.10175 Transcript_4421/m.10175 type:complete len:80 (-) Transcript_4421:132-371(-)
MRNQRPAATAGVASANRCGDEGYNPGLQAVALVAKKAESSRSAFGDIIVGVAPLACPWCPCAAAGPGLRLRAAAALPSS